MTRAQKYHRVVIQNFTASVPEDELAKAVRAQSEYPDAIAAALIRKGTGLKVTWNGDVGPGTLDPRSAAPPCDYSVSRVVDLELLPARLPA